MSMNTLRGLGWDWRENGVVLKVQTASGQTMQQEVFVPLNRVWKEFAGEFAAVGCPLPMAVGEPLTVGGLFSSIAHAVSSAAKGVAKGVSSVAKATGVTAVTKAAAKVAKVATNYAQHAVSALGKIPVIGPLANAAGNLMLLPANTVNQLAAGDRIDRVALGSLKSALANVKAIAPYAQTVLSFVPGVGQGLSGAIGASMALAAGQSISDALLAGVKGAIPGGPLAQAAFSVASDVMQGKQITTIAINALPGLSPQAKAAMLQGLDAAKRLAKGEKVSQVVIDAALKQLPPEAQKAVQIGAAIGQAKSIQDAARAAAGAATGLVSNVQKGVAAAAQIKALPPGIKAPAHLVAAVHSATQARNTLANVAQQAKAGNTAAHQIATAANILTRNPVNLTRVGLPAQVVPMYIGAPLAHHHRQARAHHARHHAHVRGGLAHWHARSA